MGENRLFRNVQGQDLFAREAKYYSSCRKAFNLRYINHLGETNSKKEGAELGLKIIVGAEIIDELEAFTCLIVVTPARSLLRVPVHKYEK